jgi:hypothetical protein
MERANGARSFFRIKYAIVADRATIKTSTGIHPVPVLSQIWFK